jgi:hypothetical protein
MKLDELVEKYIKLRDRRAKRKANFTTEDAADKLLQEKIEAVMMVKFAETGIESVKTANGTAYTSVRTSATVADRDTYFNWVLEDPAERMVFLEARANKTIVDQYRSANDEIPPGLNWSETREINFRRS